MVTNATVPQDLSSNINQGSLCGESLHAYKAKLEECNERVKTETCVEEIIDFYHCVDHCAAIEIFKAKFTNFAQTELVDLILLFIVERKINRRGMYAMKLIEKIEQLHETGLFLFAHPSSEHCLGLPIGQGLIYYFVIGGTMTRSIFILVSKGKERICIRINYVFVKSINIDPCCRSTHLSLRPYQWQPTLHRDHQ